MPPETPQRGPTVLVVEDDVDTRAALRLALEDEGFIVESAGDGLHALQRVRDHTPDVVILDLSMPRMGGEDFLFAWRSGVDTPGVPIIVISAAYKPPRPEDLGIDAFLPKPFDLRTLVRHVKRLVETAPRAQAPAGRDVRIAELREVADELADAMSVILTSVGQLAGAPSDSGDVRPLATTARESAQRGSTLVRRLHRVVSTLE